MERSIKRLLIASWFISMACVVVLFDCVVCSSQEDDDDEKVYIITQRNYRQVAELLNTLIGNNSGYNAHVLPAAPCTGRGSSRECPFIVYCRLFLIRIQDVIENAETLVTTARLQVGWNDSALQWDPAKHGGIKTLIIPPGKIWSPELQIANSVDDLFSLMHKDDFGFRVNYDGTVWYHPTGKFLTRCALDLKFYPFDYQRCSIVIESVIYTAKELITKTRSDKGDHVSRGMYAENPMWSLIDANGFTATYMTDYFQRTFFIPIALLSTLQVLTYLTPMKFVDRLPQATVVLLTAFFLQGYIAEQLPRTSGDSYVQTYINLIIALSVATVLFCTITTELVDPDDGLPMWGVMNLFLRCARRTRAPLVKSETLYEDGKEFEYISAEMANKKNFKRDVIVSVKPQRAMKTSTIIAATINWIGFIVCTGVSIGYPLCAFVFFVTSSPPPMPQPSPDNMTKSYYAEF